MLSVLLQILGQKKQGDTERFLLVCNLHDAITILIFTLAMKEKIRLDNNIFFINIGLSVEKA